MAEKNVSSLKSYKKESSLELLRRKDIDGLHTLRRLQPTKNNIFATSQTATKDHSESGKNIESNHNLQHRRIGHYDLFSIDHMVQDGTHATKPDVDLDYGALIHV